MFSSASQVCLAWLAGSHIVHSRSSVTLQPGVIIVSLRGKAIEAVLCDEASRGITMTGFSVSLFSFSLLGWQ